MKIAFVIFDHLTTLDFIGIYDPLTRLKPMKVWPDLQWEICSFTPQVADDRGLVLTPTSVRESLAGYDLLVVPGGFGTRRLVHDQDFIVWLQTSAACPLKTSVCTGSLLLGAAGFLRGRRATTHPSAFNELASYCDAVTTDRIVDEGDIITAGGVTSSIDLGLYLIARLTGIENAEQVRQRMDYRSPVEWPEKSG
jgi:transcriptional regulator GlxA family with amidase domain